MPMILTFGTSAIPDKDEWYPAKFKGYEETETKQGAAYRWKAEIVSDDDEIDGFMATRITSETVTPKSNAGKFFIQLSGLSGDELAKAEFDFENLIDEDVEIYITHNEQPDATFANIDKFRIPSSKPKVKRAKAEAPVEDPLADDNGGGDDDDEEDLLI